MATEVKINLDTLDAAVRVYNTEIANLEDALKELDSVLNRLRSEDWRSEGADTFFESYDSGWKTRFTDHISYLKHLRDCLVTAQQGFHEEYSRRLNF